MVRAAGHQLRLTVTRRLRPVHHSNVRSNLLLNWLIAHCGENVKVFGQLWKYGSMYCLRAAVPRSAFHHTTHAKHPNCDAPRHRRATCERRLCPTGAERTPMAGQAPPRRFSGAYRYWVSGMRQGIQSWRRRSDGSVDGSHLSSLKHTRIPLPLLRFRTDGQWPATIIDRQRGGRHRPANSKYWVVESQASLS